MHANPDVSIDKISCGVGEPTGWKISSPDGVVLLCPTGVNGSASVSGPPSSSSSSSLLRRPDPDRSMERMMRKKDMPLSGPLYPADTSGPFPFSPYRDSLSSPPPPSASTAATAASVATTGAVTPQGASATSSNGLSLPWADWSNKVATGLQTGANQVLSFIKAPFVDPSGRGSGLFDKTRTYFAGGPNELAAEQAPDETWRRISHCVANARERYSATWYPAIYNWYNHWNSMLSPQLMATNPQQVYAIVQSALQDLANVARSRPEKEEILQYFFKCFVTGMPVLETSRNVFSTDY